MNAEEEEEEEEEEVRVNFVPRIYSFNLPS